MKGSVRDSNIVKILDSAKLLMKDQCKRNIYRINYLCAYEGESFNHHKDCFEASKKFLRSGIFPSCKAKEAGVE